MCDQCILFLNIIDFVKTELSLVLVQALLLNSQSCVLYYNLKVQFSYELDQF